MKFKTLIPMLAVAFLGFNACNKKQDDAKPEGLQMNSQIQSNGNSTPYTQNTVQVELENGTVSFINSVRFVYTSGMSLAGFKENLIGLQNINTIPAVGNELLDKAFQLLSSNASVSEIKAQGTAAFAKATLFVLEYAKANNLSIGSNQVSAILFGGNEAGLREDDGGGCKWWQIGCHLDNIWDWIIGNPKTVNIIIKIIGIFVGLL